MNSPNAFQSLSGKILSGIKKGLLIHKKISPLLLQDILSVNLEEQELKVAVASPALPMGREITQLVNISLQGISLEDGVAKLQASLAELKLKNPQLVGVVPSHWVVTRNIEIPSRDSDEIREIVSLQATRHTPYARNEIIIDFLNLGVFKSVYTKVLLIIVPRTAILRFYELGLKLNMRIEKILFAPEAIARNASKRLSLINEKLPVCLIRIDTATTDFLVMFRGALLFVRSIPIGAQHFAVAKEGYLIRFAEELKRSLETYQGENIDQNPSAFFLAGAAGGLEDLDEMVLDALKLSVKRLSDLEGIPIRAGLKDQYSAQNWSFLHVMAPALSFGELEADLAPEENKLSRSVEERSKEIIKTGILSMGLLGLLCVYLISTLYFQKERIAQLSHRYDPIKKEAKELEEAYAHVQAVKNHLQNRGKSIEVLAELHSMMPPETYLSAIQYSGDGKLSIQGTSFSKSPIFLLVDEMERSVLFRNVQTKHITGRVEEGKELADFEIVASFE